jgi:hypothetical protein
MLLTNLRGINTNLGIVYNLNYTKVYINLEKYTIH